MWRKNTVCGTAIVYKVSNEENIVLDYKLDGDIREDKMFTNIFNISRMNVGLLQKMNILKNRGCGLKKEAFNYTKMKNDTKYIIRFYAVYDWVVYENYDDRILILNNGKTITACDNGFYVIDYEETTNITIDNIEPKFGDFVTVYNYRTDEFIKGVVIKKVGNIGKYLIITDKTSKSENLKCEKFIKLGEAKKDNYAYLCQR